MSPFPRLPAFDDPAWTSRVSHHRLTECRWTAMHEAAHLVSATAAGRKPEYVRINDHGHGQAWNAPTPIPPGPDAVSFLCGMAIECWAGNTAPWPNGQEDMARARNRIMEVVGESEPAIGTASNEAWDAACVFVSEPTALSAIREVAAYLLLHGALDAPFLNALLDPRRRRLPGLSALEWQWRPPAAQRAPAPPPPWRRALWR